MNERSSSFGPTGGAVVDGLCTHLDTHTLHVTGWHQFLQILIYASCTLGQGDFTLICATSTTSPAPLSQPCVTFTVLWESGKNPSGFASHCLSVLSWMDWCVLHKPANKSNMRAGLSVAHRQTGVTHSWTVFFWKLPKSWHMWRYWSKNCSYAVSSITFTQACFRSPPEWQLRALC